MRKILLTLVLSLLVLGLSAASFDIEAYDIAIKVEKDGTLNVKETIDVRFFEKSHGIYRDIQYSFENPNGNSFDPVKADISIIKATSLYKKEKEDGILRLTLGDPDKYANERERYVIEYDYRLDYNRTEGYDELYYNIISPSWEVNISNVTWRVEMPSPVEKNRIWVTEGKEGSLRKGSFAINTTSTLISGEKDLVLPKGAITLRVEMDKGYWKGWGNKADNSFPFTLTGSLLALIFTITAIISWFIFGKDEKIDCSGRTSTPPSGINPLDAGFLIDQNSSPDKEGFAMIFNWAEEGRLTITEKEGEKKNKPSYTFTKIKDLDDDVKQSERALFDSVFFKDEVTMQELVDHGFANDYASKVVKNLIKENKGDKDRKSVILQTVFIVLGLVATIASAILFSMRFPGLLSLIMVIIFFIPSFLVALVSSLYSESGKIWKKKTRILVYTLTLLVVFGGALLLSLLTKDAQLSLFNTLSAVISYFLYTIAMAFSSLMDKKSSEGNEKLKACLEYRNYLSDLLEGEYMPTEEDKEIWGKHMAYALALGLDTKNNKVELDMPQPSWFYGSSWQSGWFTYYILFHSCTSSYSTSVFNSTGHTTPGGGGFSSTGFSGGGFSGGGGGSW